MTSSRRVLLSVLTASLVLVTSLPASADVVSRYELNEKSTSSTMYNAVSGGPRGTIGSDVVVGATTPGAWRAYEFVGPAWVYNPNRLVTVPDDARLEPQSSDFRMTIRLQTTVRHPNVVQKGQSGQRGGFWKFELKSGWPTCHFTDGAGTTAAVGLVNSTNPNAEVADGEWHVVRCTKTSTTVKVEVDPGTANAVSRTYKKATGAIDNSGSLSLGGKSQCDGSTVHCDYFNGFVDWVEFDKG